MDLPGSRAEVGRRFVGDDGDRGGRDETPPAEHLGGQRAGDVVHHERLGDQRTYARVDADRIGMVGVSFGAHWSARMAVRDKRIKAVVCNGGLYHRSFRPTATFGMPAIILETLRNSTGATGLVDLGRRLHALSLKAGYPDIKVPLLVINGDADTLVSTQDSVDLADAVPNSELILYPNDDHCAMGHYSEWLATSVDWLQRHLG